MVARQLRPILATHELRRGAASPITCPAPGTVDAAPVIRLRISLIEVLLD
jgi:hypothetical protein